MRPISSMFVACASVALFSACGSGGGSSGAATTLPATVAITSSNYVGVAQATVNGGMAVAQSKGLDAQGRTTTQSITPAASPGRLAAIEAVVRQTLSGAFGQQRRVIASANAHASAAMSQPGACASGGSLTVTVDDKDNSGTASIGDTISVAFTQCQETVGDVIDGTVVVTLKSVSSATASLLQFTGTMAFQQVSAKIGQTTANIEGTVSVSMVETSASVNVSLTVGAGGLTVTAASTTYNDTIVYDTGMQIATIETTAPSSTSATLTGSLTATSLGGRIVVTTANPIVQGSADAYPSAGQVIITGASGSVLRITVIDTTQVRLELDADGNGSYETDNVVPWGTLLPA